MGILYKSTRGKEKGIEGSEAILKGIASDGGLFVPEKVPGADFSPIEISKMTYKQLAFRVMQLYLTDYTAEELKSCIDAAYDGKFDTGEIVPVREADGAYFMELFHGKTIAFKDMALSILPHLMTTAAKKHDIKEKIMILTATSGDTGKAAMAGFADVPGTGIIVFYPKDGVSAVQEKQMVTQKGDNTCVIAIRGNFDDAQTGVKKMFADEELKAELLKAGYRFSSANSINIGRLIPQIVYYFYGYADLVRKGVIKGGERINIVVPTGNFGNILAAYYAKDMGMPVERLICASNENKVLYDFFKTGEYNKNRPFILTTSPSMDILVSSNLERLIYKVSGDDGEATARYMKELSETGRYTITPEMQEKLGVFYGGFAGEAEVMDTIRSIYEKDGYVIDPHTAVAAAVYRKYREETGDGRPTLIASTASPYKFARTVLHAAAEGEYDADSDMEQFDNLNRLSGVPVPAAIKELMDAPVRHEKVCDSFSMEKAVREELGL